MIKPRPAMATLGCAKALSISAGPNTNDHILHLELECLLLNDTAASTHENGVSEVISTCWWFAVVPTGTIVLPMSLYNCSTVGTDLQNVVPATMQLQS